MKSSPVLPTVQDNYEVSFAEVRLPETSELVSDTMPENIRPTAVIKTSTMTIALSNDISESLLSRILGRCRMLEDLAGIRRVCLHVAE